MKNSPPRQRPTTAARLRIAWKEVDMFREMRRKKQALSFGECVAVLLHGTSGVLAVAGDDDYPYAVPLSYAYTDSKIYFHWATAGHKLEAIKRHSKVSFCVIDKDEVRPEEYTTYFRSVIAFGQARVLDDPEEKLRALEILAARYSPDQVEGRRREIDRLFQQVCMVELAVEHLTGKEAIELMKKRMRQTD